ncbi:MAG: TetR/AcrR family transcriptional regulator, partial [Burkholderiales bacterium]
MPAALPEQPRKRPVQSRSVHTVDAIVQAGIQVLLTHGAERLTTTRVAERAGVSVGTLYQYFPNKASLLAFALSRHLESVVDAVEAACARGRGSPLAIVAAEATGAFVDAKFADPDTSRALYAIGPELGAARIV